MLQLLQAGCGNAQGELRGLGLQMAGPFDQHLEHNLSHGGIAFGLDRLAMLMSGAESIRDVIAFPKTQTAACPLTDAPTEVTEKQLRELHIRLRQTTPPASSN